jgi:type I restriction enzyme S subunit
MNNWPVRPVRALADVALGRQRAPQHEQGPHLVPYLRAANVSDGRLNLDDIKEMNFSPAEQSVFALRPGDVLVTEGSGSLGTVGASATWQGEIPGTVCFQNTLLRLRPKDGETDPRFLAWWSRATFADGVYASIASGANIFHLSAERVRALPLHRPPLDEQRRIADFLDTETARIDQLAKLRASQAEALGLRYQSQLSKVTQRLSDQHGTVKVRYVLQKIEQGWSPQCEDRPSNEGEWGVVKAGCVNGGTFDAAQQKALPANTSPELRYRLRPGDLLMSRASGSVDLIGSIAVLPGDLPDQLLLCDKVYRLRMDRTRMSAPFVAFMLRTLQVREQIKLGISGAEGMANNLPTATITNLPLPNVPLSEQSSVVNALDDAWSAVRGTRQKLREQLNVLAERRQALVTAAVTGGITV